MGTAKECQTDGIIMFSSFQPQAVKRDIPAAVPHLGTWFHQPTIWNRLPTLTNGNTEAQLAKLMHPEALPLVTDNSKSGSPSHCPQLLLTRTVPRWKKKWQTLLLPSTGPWGKMVVSNRGHRILIPQSPSLHQSLAFHRHKTSTLKKKRAQNELGKDPINQNQPAENKCMSVTDLLKIAFLHWLCLRDNVCFNGRVSVDFPIQPSSANIIYSSFFITWLNFNSPIALS